MIFLVALMSCPLHYLLSVPIFNKKSHWGLKLWFLSFPLNYADPLVWVDYCILLPRSGSYFICSKTHQKFAILGLGTPAGQDRGHPMNSMMPYIPTGKSNSTIEIKWTLLKDYACEKSLLFYIENLFITYSIQLFGRKAAYRLAKKNDSACTFNNIRFYSIKYDPYAILMYKFFGYILKP